MKSNEPEFDPYAEMVKEKSPELFCDSCGHYPIEPVHGHFMCPACHMPTKCCEGMPLDVWKGKEQPERRIYSGVPRDEKNR